MTSQVRPKLFTPTTLRGVTVRNRIMLSPMNQHRAHDGYADDGLLVHLGKFALGGFGIIMTEATAIEPRGRVAPGISEYGRTTMSPDCNAFATMCEAQAVRRACN